MMGNYTEDGLLQVQSEVHAIDGLPFNDIAILQLRGEKMVTASQNHKFSLPTSLSDWSSLINTQIRFEYNDSVNFTYASFQCEITQFSMP